MKAITRNGVLNFKGKSVGNQCNTEGHEIYYYTVKILFPADVKYNQKNFIIDHIQLDESIQEVGLSSCEKISENILQIIKNLFSHKDIGYIGFKIRIQPEQIVNPVKGAYFEEFYCRNEIFLPILVAL